MIKVDIYDKYCDEIYSYVVKYKLQYFLPLFIFSVVSGLSRIEVGNYVYNIIIFIVHKSKST